MIKEIKICDCCGKECDFFFAIIETYIPPMLNFPDSSYDICKECYESFEELLKSKCLNEVKND